ncbi:MAG: DUF4855 domain-containing protein [Armatimonadetes bacterium]|nr:DUF4855 domain-containing protein [Armatimonadota bacterium]
MRRLSLLALLLVTIVCSQADYCPPDSPQSGGMRDIMLAYMGRDAWKQAAFLPYVAYLDKQQGGKPVDWFYDSWLFLMFGGAPSGGSYAFGSATKADWDFYFDLLFAPDQNLAALNACVEEVGRQLGDTDQVCPVIIMIPHLAPTMRDFGDVDGDGQPEDCSRDADRLKAFRWAVDTVLARWRPEAYPHLRLWGFYWMNEGVYGEDEQVCKDTAAYCHSKGYGLHWIPWFRAGGFDRWRDLGFDFVVMQPNYAFMKNPAGAVVPDEGRLTHNANLSRDHGLGVEMELDTNTEVSPGKRLNLQLYLNHGVDELDGYMNGAVRAYYQAEDFIARLYHSDLRDANRLYDDLYRFHKGTYQRRVVSLCEGAPCTLNGQPAPKLTDGVWLTRGERPERVMTAKSPAVIELDLGPGQIVGDVRVHVAARDGGQPSRPLAVQVETSGGDGAYARVSEAACPELVSRAGWSQGFVLVTCKPHFARAVRITLTAPEGAEVGVDEVVMFPAPHLLWGAPGEVAGEPVGVPAVEAVTLLTDGKLAAGADQPGTLRFADNGGSATLHLNEAWVLQQARVHVSWTPDAGAPRCRVSALAGDDVAYESAWAEAAGEGSAWLELPLASARADTVRFEFSGGRGVGWDETQVTPTPNLAQGKPYTIAPDNERTYDDTGGRELTDGLLTETGFSDGRTVGWFGEGVTVTMDLGREQEPEAVRVFTQGGDYAAVRFPATYQVFGSVDGADWRLLAGGRPEMETVFRQPVGDVVNELAWLGLRLPGTAVRYLRLVFPSNAWLMLSEIEALVRGQNVALGASYHLAPKPKSEAKYADDGIRLTDGDTSRPADGWNKVVGWSEATPEVVVDLLAPARVSLVRAHVLGGGNGGVWYPTSVAVSTSEDGTTWSDEVAVSPSLPEAGRESLVAFVDVEMSPRMARYVRLRLERKGWAMLDEVQVYDTTR